MTTSATYLLSVVIPIGPLRGRLQAIQKTVNDCRVLPVQLILVCDDHQDGTKEELENILNTCMIQNVELISGEFNGPGRARTAGLALTSAPWIAFWDADDYPSVQKSLLAIGELNVSSADVICNQYAIHDDTSMEKIYGSTVRVSESENLRAIGTQPGIWRFLFRKELISDMEFFDSRMGEDQEFLARVFVKNPKIQFTTHQAYQYLVSRIGQLTGDKSNISQLVDIAPRLKSAYLKAPAKYQECLKLMLNQVVLTMAMGGDKKVRLGAVKYMAVNLFSFLGCFFIILREKRLRNG